MAVHPLDPGLNSAYDDDYYDSTTPHPESTTRLASQHTTEGYRDGITASKQEYIQEGFDEGYILGAALGLKVGELLGVLDGLVGTIQGLFNKQAVDDSDEKDKLCARLKEQKKVRDAAKNELNLEKVFGNEYFGEDGIWKWTAEDDGDDRTFDDIVAQHPLIVKWAAIVGKQSEVMDLELAGDSKNEGQSDDS